MLAYEWLKADPQKNGPRLHRWSDLFIDTDVPLSVKKELQGLDKINIDVNDSFLYFYDDALMRNFTTQRTKACYENSILRWKEHMWFIETLYSMIQLKMIDTEQAYRILDVNKPGSIRFELTIMQELSFDENCHIISNAIAARHSINCVSLIYVLRPTTGIVGFYGERAFKLLRYMSLDFVRAATDEQCHHVADIADDVPVPDINHRYKSLNELQKAHDARTQKEEERILKSEKHLFYYNTELKEIVERYGFKLPKSRAAMVVRGNQHHNCVATYADKHIDYVFENTVSAKTLILFSDVATIELVCFIIYNKIVATEVRQCKGMRNKNMALTEDLIDMRIALTGKSIDILRVEER